MPVTRSQRSTSAPPSARRAHVVDHALEYARLAASGMRGSEIARQKRRSKGYVSILVRLGRILASCRPDEIEAFRSERITWKIAQRVVRANTADVIVLTQLRHALGGFSGHNVDRRKFRRRRGSNERREAERAGLFVWRWDSMAAREPEEYVASLTDHCARLVRDTASRLRQSDASARGSVPLAGQSLRQLQRTLGSVVPTSGSAAPPLTFRTALAELERMHRTLVRGRSEPEEA